MSVYVLELEGGRYYVGYTDDVPRRIAEHFLGRGGRLDPNAPAYQGAGGRAGEQGPGKRHDDRAHVQVWMAERARRHVV